MNHPNEDYTHLIRDADRQLDWERSGIPNAVKLKGFSSFLWTSKNEIKDEFYSNKYSDHVSFFFQVKYKKNLNCQ